MGQYLKSPPVADKVGLQAQHSLTDGEGNLDGDSDQRSEPGAHVLHHQHEADHEAADASHPRQDPRQPVPVCAPSTAAERSEQEKDIFLAPTGAQKFLCTSVRVSIRLVRLLSQVSLNFISKSFTFSPSFISKSFTLSLRIPSILVGLGQMGPKVPRPVFSNFFFFSDL